MFVLPITDWNDIFWFLGYISLALAILFLGLSLVPLGYTFKLLCHREPSVKELLEVRKFIGGIVIASCLFFIIAAGYYLIRIAFTFSYWLSSLLYKDNITIINIVGVSLSILTLIFIVWFIRFLWRFSKKLPDIKTETEPIVASSQNLNNTLIQLIEVIKQREVQTDKLIKLLEKKGRDNNGKL
jgi:hypothetical protein